MDLQGQPVSLLFLILDVVVGQSGDLPSRHVLFSLMLQDRASPLTIPMLQLAVPCRNVHAHVGPSLYNWTRIVGCNASIAPTAFGRRDYRNLCYKTASLYVVVPEHAEVLVNDRSLTRQIRRQPGWVLPQTASK
ncbi:hypothetical protein V1517DRAFT_16797 [Lipomyces orientalis]|uniref:Uncharacterized protein n=1 Tax=Lipomyces orientalis TaxID=1233043 RepID=A0ACC3TH62_9ASCO